MNNKFPLKKILILVSILALPGFLYYLLQEKGENRYRPLPVFGAKKLSGTYHTRRGKKIPDTIFHTINDFTLLDQRGDTLRFNEDTSRISVVNFFYTQCAEPCQKMNRAFGRVADRFKDNRLMRFLSISVDPNDSPEALAKYAKSLNAPEKWNFYSGNPQTISVAAKEGFLVDAFADTARADSFVHSPLFILVDPQKRIRGFYDSSSKEQVDRLIDEIKVLIAEELRKG